MAGIRLSTLAQVDIVDLLAWTADRFGPLAQERYEALLSAALSALVENPRRTGTAARPELGDGVGTYHLRHMKKRSKVARPRHVVLYRVGDGGSVEVGRVLHDAMELERHAIFDFESGLEH